ncbi:MAG TPA: hypothetical protein VGB22_02215 [candidate division Zixibacteria bacterium]
MRRMEFCAAILLLMASAAHAANTVIVESKSVIPGSDSVTLGVYFANDDSLRGLAVPLELRSTSGGAFIENSLTISAGGRFLVWDTAGQGTNLYRRMGQKGAPGITSCAPDSIGLVWGSSPLDTAADFVSPDAALYWGYGVATDISPGDDGLPGAGTPSLALSFDVASASGTFEIDTTCAAPDNHLLYVTGLDPGTDLIVPEFTSGIVTVMCECTCHADPACDGLVNVFDVVLAVDVAFRNGAAVTDPLCPYERTDVNCSDETDVFDVVALVDVAFRSGDPGAVFCDPCG